MAELYYKRVSTARQKMDRQDDAAEHLGIHPAMQHEEKISTRVPAADRPVLQKVIGLLQTGDVLIVHHLDRLGRDTEDILATARTIRDKGAHLRVTKMALDTATPMGRFFFTVAAAFGELERDLSAERAEEGREAARRRGHLGGRPARLTADQIKNVAQMAAADISISEIARVYDVSRPTVHRAIQRVREDAGQS